MASSRQRRRVRTRVDTPQPVRGTGRALRVAPDLLRSLAPAEGVDRMRLARSMLKTVRQGMAAIFCCMWIGAPAPQAMAQAGVAGSLSRGSPQFAAPAWSVWGGAVRSDFAARHWGCHPGWGACIGSAELRLILERQRRLDVLRNESAADQAPSAGGLWRVPPYAYLPPPTPEDQIVPAYRDRSVPRPEFQDSGKSLH